MLGMHSSGYRSYGGQSHHHTDLLGRRHQSNPPIWMLGMHRCVRSWASLSDPTDVSHPCSMSELGIPNNPPHTLACPLLRIPFPCTDQEYHQHCTHRCCIHRTRKDIPPGDLLGRLAPRLCRQEWSNRDSFRRSTRCVWRRTSSPARRSRFHSPIH